MALQTTGALSYSQIRTEFGQSGAVNISAYKRGAGIVPNHTANASIPTTNSNIAVNNFYGAELAFTCDLTEGASGSDEFGFSVSSSIGSVSRDGIGKSVSNSDQVVFVSFSDFYFKSSYIVTIFTIEGDHTGSWWSTIVYRSKTFTRTSASTPTGAFSGGTPGTTSWEITNGPYCTGSGTHLFTLNLT